MSIDPSDFIKRHRFAVLSTQSLSHPGYPFGSLVPYLISPQGRIALFISNLAEHSKNIAANNKVALTITDTGTLDSPRLTCLAEAYISQSQQALREGYRQQFADADQVLALPGFQFIELSLTAVRLIGGFGDIHWLEPSQLHLRPGT